jgi:hypothetical protein
VLDVGEFAGDDDAAVTGPLRRAQGLHLRQKID